MVIHANTKISQLLKENSQALAAISSLAKPLEKLRNPLLRKLMASRTTIKEAAAIGGCSVEDFFSVLSPLGFEITPDHTKGLDNTGKGKGLSTQTTTRPDWLTHLTPDQITPFDVRQMLSTGHDPLKEIMAAYKKIQPGRALQIINTFVPTPLLKLLENKGAKTYSDKIADRLVHSYFFRPVHVSQDQTMLPKEDQLPKTATKTSSIQSGDLITTLDAAGFQSRLDHFSKDQLKEIDVRALEMPEPMQLILKELEVLPAHHGLYVHHKRIPVYLLEDVQSTGKYKVFILPIDQTRFDLLLTANRLPK